MLDGCGVKNQKKQEPYSGLAYTILLTFKLTIDIKRIAMLEVKNLSNVMAFIESILVESFTREDAHGNCVTFANRTRGTYQ